MVENFEIFNLLFDFCAHIDSIWYWNFQTFRLYNSEIADECSRYKTRVIKSIRYNNLEYATPLLADEKLRVKMIMLIRDPRAIMSSRLKILNHQKSHFNMLRHEIDPVEYFLNMLERRRFYRKISASITFFKHYLCVKK